MAKTHIPTRAGKLYTSSIRRYIVVADNLTKAKARSERSPSTFVFDRRFGQVVYTPFGRKFD